GRDSGWAAGCCRGGAEPPGMLVLRSVMLKTLATVDDLDSPIRQSCWRAARSWLDVIERVGRYPDLLDRVMQSC
ncbi:hypothetical protein ACLOJK_029231, partial [Asimina triloba]